RPRAPRLRGSRGSRRSRAAARGRRACPDACVVYCLTYGLPSAAGGTVRPTTPQTAISVRMYGNVWNRVAAESEYTGRRYASAVQKPNSNAAANVPNGRQAPKISAARAMKPRPAVMLSVNAPPPKPIERYAPPSPARIPEVTTDP